MGTYCELSRDEQPKSEKQVVSSDEFNSSPSWRISQIIQAATSAQTTKDEFENSGELSPRQGVNTYYNIITEKTTPRTTTSSEITSNLFKTTSESFKSSETGIAEITSEEIKEETNEKRVKEASPVDSTFKEPLRKKFYLI